MANNDPSEKSSELLTVRITDLSRGGAGVAREESGRVIFVPLTAPGDEVVIRVVSEQKRYAQGELVEILAPSPQRQKPRCPVFGRCGGCQWQHIAYETQWKTKSSGVRHALERVRVALPGPLEELPAQQIWNYRNRIQMRGFREEIGFFASRSHERVGIERCEIARDELNERIPEIRRKGMELSEPYKVEIEVLPTGETRQTWNSAHAASGFRQIHDDQNEKLKAWVASVLQPGRLLLDLYGGAGNLSLPLAERMAEIHCVDVSSPRSAPAGTPANYRFHRNPVLPWLLTQARLQEISSKNRRVPVSAIVDPPREGLGPDLNAIAQSLESLGASELVAVGCDPDSWARDLARLTQRGWSVKRVGALDLFPQTPHVEAIALLSL